jgi:predicted MFS family arabinose efflux permease
MPPWLAVWIARWASGEKFRKATPEDYRWHFASFFFAGVLMIVGTIFGRRFLDHASSVSIWICATVVMVAMVFGAIAWARRVPAAVSLILAIVTWGVFVWLALRETHIL